MKNTNAPRWLNVAPGIDLLTRPWSDEEETEAWPRLQSLIVGYHRQIEAGDWRALPDLSARAGLAAMALRLYCAAIAQVAVIGWRGPAAPLLADGAARDAALADLMSDPDVAAAFLRRWRGAAGLKAVRRGIAKTLWIEGAL